MAPIQVPKTPKSAYNPNRLISGLLRSQIEMLESATASYESDPSATKAKRPTTEGAAAKYIQELHGRLKGHLEKQARDAAEADAVDGVLAGVRTPKRSTYSVTLASGAKTRPSFSTRAPRPAPRTPGKTASKKPKARRSTRRAVTRKRRPQPRRKRNRR